MHHYGPFDRRTLRKMVVAGQIDAQSLVCESGDNVMLPLGCSKAAKEITAIARDWRWKYSPLFYFSWLIFMPLFSAGVAGIGISNSASATQWLPVAIMSGMVGLCVWLFYTWRILLVEERPKAWKAALFAFPMLLPFFNIFWIWIGYMQMPKYWHKFKLRHDLHDASHYLLYYISLILFYLMVGIYCIMCFGDQYTKAVMVIYLGISSWLWFGSTMLSLFMTDHITLQIIKNKLSKLAFGALRFCADVNYDVMHKAVLTLAFRARRSTRIICGTLLLISWLAGGFLWLIAIEECSSEYHTKVQKSHFDTFFYGREIKNILEL